MNEILVTDGELRLSFPNDLFKDATVQITLKWDMIKRNGVYCEFSIQFKDFLSDGLGSDRRTDNVSLFSFIFYLYKYFKLTFFAVAKLPSPCV